MRAVRKTPAGIEVVDVPAPEGPGVRVRVGAVGICGSDLSVVAAASWPYTLGHEIAGHLDDGTPVAVEPLVPCGTCDQCEGGHVNRCRLGRSIGLGFGRDGGMCEEIVVPARSLIALAPGIRVGDAALVEPLAVAVHGVRVAAVVPGQRVLVVGAGAVGLACVVAARAAGAEVGLVARHPHQRAAGERLGASSPSGEYDIVVDAAGTGEAVATAVEACRPGGTLLVLAPHGETVRVHGSDLLLKELRVVGSIYYGWGGVERDTDVAARLLADHPELPDVLITHRFGLEDAAEAFRLAAARDGGSIKVVVHP